MTPAAATALTLLWLTVTGDAAAQSADNVAVIINDNSAASQLIGEHYVRKRSIPAANVIRIHAPTDESIDRATYNATIEGPIGEALGRAGLQDQIAYIVLTKGVPLRVNGSAGQSGTVSSVDSELTLLYRRLTGVTVETTGQIPNPYFLGTGPLRDARRFSHREHDIYLVTRLDAFTVAYDDGSEPFRLASAASIGPCSSACAKRVRPRSRIFGIASSRSAIPTCGNSSTPLGTMKHLQPGTPNSARPAKALLLPGTTPPQNATST